MVSHSVMSDPVISWTVAQQAPLSMEFSRQEYWSGLPCPSTGNFPKQGIEPRSLQCRWILYYPSHQRSPVIHHQSVRSVAQLCPTLWDPMNRSTPGLPVHHQLSESTQTHVHWVGDAIQPSHPLSSPSPSALNFPSIRVFSNELALRIRWPQYWSFSFNISPSNEHPGLVSFRMDVLDLLAVQGTLKRLLQHHSTKAWILRCSAFFMVQIHIHIWPVEKP